MPSDPPSQPPFEPTLLEQAVSPEGFSPEVALGEIAVKQHYGAIGLIASNWAYFEALIDDFLIRLAGLASEAGVCFTAQIVGSGRKLDAYISLAQWRGASQKSVKDLKKFAQDTIGYAEQRNRAVHDVWFLDDPHDPKRIEATARKQLRLGPVSVSTGDLLKLGRDIDLHTQRFEDLAIKVHAETLPLLPHRE